MLIEHLGEKKLGESHTAHFYMPHKFCEKYSFPYTKIWLQINVELCSYKFSIIHKVEFVPVHAQEKHLE
jgi:hypothetical protein